MPQRHAMRLYIYRLYLDFNDCLDAHKYTVFYGAWGPSFLGHGWGWGRDWGHMHMASGVCTF